MSQRTTKHVDFTGIEFRKLSAYHELRNNSSKLVKQAWPPGLIEWSRTATEALAGSETLNARLKIGLCGNQ